MRRWLLEHLVCPKTQETLCLHDAEERDGEILSGMLVSSSARYPIVAGIPRFVDRHYATAFGLQWKTHASTQIDTQRHSHSAERFWGETGFTAEGLNGKLILDGGCGAGRFTNIAASVGGRVVAIDLSEAVSACYQNHVGCENVAVVQADLLNLPFRPKTFDVAFTIGVIQHTPEPLQALASIAATVKPGGEIAVSWYKRYWYTYLHQKYVLRPLFRGWNDERLYRFISQYVPKLLPVSRFLNRFLPGSILDRILPVANRDFIPGLTSEEKLEWAVLDTFDWFNPVYDLPQRWSDVQRTLEAQGFRCERAPAERRGLRGVRA